MYYLALFRQSMCLFYLNVEPYATKALFICNKTSNVTLRFDFAPVRFRKGVHLCAK